MNGFVIKYNDIYNLLWEYKSKLENLMERIDVCQESINRFIGDSGFQGKAATAIKSYMNDVHLTMLSSFRVTIQSLLDNIVLYKAGYYGIDDSTNFELPEETIKEFRTKLNTNYMDMQEQEDGVYRAVSGITDISSVGQPDTNQVPQIHQQLDQELLNLITDIEMQESSTVTALEQSTELLITSLNNCIGKIGTNWTDINNYESNSFYTDVDAYALANLSQMFYQQHEANQEVYDEIWKVEQSLKDAAEERETMGIWKTIGGGVLVITGVLCIAASGGAATPVVVAGWTSGGVTVAFGVCDSIEGAQDIYYGSMGDIDSTAFNCLKDVVFQGNEDAYYMVESIFACSASACIPISKASQVGQLTFRSGSVIAAKEVMSTVIGDKASELTMDLTGNRTLSMLAGMMASNASANGLNGLDARFNWSGYTYKSLLGKMSPEEAKAYDHFMKNGSEAGLTEIELNALQKVDGQIALNKIDGDELLKVRGGGETSYGKSSLNSLENTENFTDSAIEHIFEGQVNVRGKAVGYHYEGIEGTSGKIIPGTESSVNNFGVYKAQVEVDGIPKTANGGYSTFYSKDMSPQQVVDAINEAYSNCELKPGTRNTYQGVANNGMQIDMFLDQNGNIISAFPKE